MSPRYVNDSIHSISQKFCREFEQSAVHKVVKKLSGWVIGNSSPSPQGREDKSFRKSHGMKIYKNLKLLFYNIYVLLLFLFFMFVSVILIALLILFLPRRHPEPRIPPDSRSVQILYRISGMLNESNRYTHRWWYVSCIYYIGTNGNRKCQANFLWMTRL